MLCRQLVLRGNQGPGPRRRDAAVVVSDRPLVGIVAALSAITIAVAIACGARLYASRLAARRLRDVAALSSRIKSDTLTIQAAAFADPRMLPIYGSSELYCCGDPYRPTQLFAPERTGFGTFALGAYGTDNLLFMQALGALGHAISGRKLVISDSPSWFFRAPAGATRNYEHNFSPEIAYMFIFDSPISSDLRAAAVRRMLSYPQTVADLPLLQLALGLLADPTPLHRAAWRAIAPLGRLEAWVDRSLDSVQTILFIQHRHDHADSPATVTPPRWDALAARAVKIARGRSFNNPFGFESRTFRRMVQRPGVANALQLYRSGRNNRDGEVYPEPTSWENEMLHSAGWEDLDLALSVLRELGAKPLLWTLPLPGHFDDYTPISASARRMFYDKWERFVASSGVPWLDFRSEDEDRYFVADHVPHLSPYGWVLADSALDLFWHGQPIDSIRNEVTMLSAEAPRR